ncbi:homocysteine S-methyltransferase [Hypericibacter adhaerens]|uniref:Homocysteine S-methyltransferase n=1 Tax=Hypericibacter adhaerens TaxID=2602016 RepID=A0A5J6MUH7_9PROT|nr:homocysteine S-methyltransferase family protein [Hypericibacter adhaerens]QEX20803.1 homocysteine S-methyltransferase [Hypericibacter adhaerens]
MTPTLPLPDRTVLLDGGMGRELRMRGVPILETIWSANALVVAPEVVRQVHQDYIAAGAEIVTTNSYGVIRADLAKEGIEHRFAELNRMAGALAREARDRSGRKAFIAGSLPPLRGSYRPDLVGSHAEIEPLYEEQASLLAPYCDLMLCETMSSATEAVAAATAAARTGLPVWVSWTLHEDNSGRLRSGESVTEAAKAIAHLPVSAFLVNCCSPESITAAMPELARLPGGIAGGYANAFRPVPADWTLEAGGLLPLRDDLDPESYAHHAGHWHAAGARVVGGCCGTRPAHIARLRQMIAKESGA